MKRVMGVSLGIALLLVAPSALAGGVGMTMISLLQGILGKIFMP